MCYRGQVSATGRDRETPPPSPVPPPPWWSRLHAKFQRLKKIHQPKEG